VIEHTLRVPVGTGANPGRGPGRAHRDGSTVEPSCLDCFSGASKELTGPAGSSPARVSAAPPGSGPVPNRTGRTAEARTVEASRRSRGRRGHGAGLGGLSLAHYRVLSAIAAGTSGLAGSPFASRSASHRERLGRDSLFARVAGSLDHRGRQRAVQLSLTEAGTEMLERAQLAMTSALEALAARAGRRDDVIDALVALARAIDQAAAERRR